MRARVMPHPFPRFANASLEFFSFLQFKARPINVHMNEWELKMWKSFFFWPIFWLSFRPRKPDCKLHKKLTQLGKGKKSEFLSWKPIQCVVKILPKLSPKKSDKKWNFRTLKQWSDSPEHLITNFCASKKSIFCDFKIDGKVRRRTIEKVSLISQRTGNRKSLGKFNLPSFSFFSA